MSSECLQVIRNSYTVNEERPEKSNEIQGVPIHFPQSYARFYPLRIILEIQFGKIMKSH